MAWENKKPIIALCCPFYSDVSMEFVMKTWLPLHAEEDWCNKLTVLSRAPSLPYARNQLVRRALEYDADYILMVDSDTIFSKNSRQMLKLLFNVQKPIVSGIYRSKKEEGFDYAAWIKKEKREGDKIIVYYAPIEEKYAENETNIGQVDLVGFGCVLIKADIFRRLQPPWFVWDDKTGDSEDFFLQKRAQKELGNEMYPWVHFGVRCDHAGGGNLVITCSGDVRVMKFD